MNFEEITKYEESLWRQKSRLFFLFLRKKNQKQFNFKISLLLPRPSSSGKRWRICGLGHKFKPHTMQSKARIKSNGIT
ncbi:hypothetical protein H5410_012900 [Solanum commersonii]|uniref:Uncharacterized protein n=1 Tax=Solanum commersonii TaxID=4109 RepID=A0A9J6ATY2_SOLCO|nr:hypothetical protein H5410_012900 [Solanum commersonii]